MFNSFVNLTNINIEFVWEQSNRIAPHLLGGCLGVFVVLVVGCFCRQTFKKSLANKFNIQPYHGVRVNESTLSVEYSGFNKPATVEVRLNVVQLKEMKHKYPRLYSLLVKRPEFKFLVLECPGTTWPFLKCVANLKSGGEATFFFETLAELECGISKIMTCLWDPHDQKKICYTLDGKISVQSLDSTIKWSHKFWAKTSCEVNNKALNACFESFYHTDKENIMALLRERVSRNVGACLFLEGPPGAGKTDFLYRLIAFNYIKSSSILCEPTFGVEVYTRSTTPILQCFENKNSGPGILAFDEFEKMLSSDKTQLAEDLARGEKRKAELTAAITESLKNSEFPYKRDILQAEHDLVEKKLHDMRLKNVRSAAIKEELLGVFLTKIPALVSTGAWVVFIVNNAGPFFSLWEPAQLEFFRPGRMELIQFTELVSLETFLRERYSISSWLCKRLSKMFNSRKISQLAFIGQVLDVQLLRSPGEPPLTDKQLYAKIEQYTNWKVSSIESLKFIDGAAKEGTSY